MSYNRSNGHYQTIAQSEILRGLRRTRTAPIACRVCDRIFFDNVSLVLHFDERHPAVDVSTLGRLSLNLSNFSSPPLPSPSPSPYASVFMGRMNGTRPLEFPRMNGFSRPSLLPVFSSPITPNVAPRDVNLVQIPVMNSMSQINLSFGARQNLSQSFGPSIMTTTRSTPSLTHHPSIHSRFGAVSTSRGLAPVPPMVLNEPSGGQRQVSDYRHPAQEIIVISDDEEDVAELDLNLRL